VRRETGLLALLVGVPVAAGAQVASLTVELRGRTPQVTTAALLADGKFPALMRSGLPLRLHYRLELWRVRGAWFDQFVRDVPWDVVARHDPLADDFVLIRPNGRLSRHATDEALASALGIPYRIPVATEGAGRFYFLCRLEVTTLNESDMAELDRWLRGEVGPAVAGGGGVGDALARGLQRVLVRMAGLPRLYLEARSPSFQTDGR
jgi:hypothetical protein